VAKVGASSELSIRDIMALRAAMDTGVLVTGFASAAACRCNLLAALDG
jgi:hypothetical protein